MANKRSMLCGLKDDAKKQYTEKMKLFSDIDPYCRMESKGKSTVFAEVE